MENNQYLYGIIENNKSNQRLDQSLSKLFTNYSRSKIKKLILEGLVKVDGSIIYKPKKKIQGKKIVSIKIKKENICSYEARNINLDIVYEDNDLIVINKKSNFVVHPGVKNFNNTLFNALIYHYPSIINVPRAGIIHRLDKDTTGLLLIAKNIKSRNQLIKLFQERKITRKYEAIVIGRINKNGSIKKPIARHPKKRIIMAVRPNGKLAITNYRVIEIFKNFTRIRVRLETGRMHQIRAHMFYIKHPILGDPIYKLKQNKKLNCKEESYSVINNFNRQALHAFYLRFLHPTSFRKIVIKIPLPKDMENLLKALKKYSNSIRIDY